MKKYSLVFLLVLVFVACKKNDNKDLRNTFRYKNDTSYPVQVIVYGEGAISLTLIKTDTIKLAPSEMAERSDYRVGGLFKGDNTEPFQGLADSAKIVFDGKKQLLFKAGKTCNSNILCRNAYKKEVEYDKLILQFTIDNKLYKLSQEIK